VQVSRANKKQEKTITNTNQLNLPMSFAWLIYRIIFSEQSDENKPFQQNVQVSRANKKK
jgi:hypothetical protein